jgi:hypothetical protein
MHGHKTSITDGFQEERFDSIQERERERERTGMGEGVSLRKRRGRKRERGNEAEWVKSKEGMQGAVLCHGYDMEMRGDMDSKDPRKGGRKRKMKTQGEGNRDRDERASGRRDGIRRRRS